MTPSSSPPSPEQRRTAQARYIMIGGFLGAGKTTAVARLAQRLAEQGHRLGLITNDQGSGLVDTAMLRSCGFATEEIAGGCFCCRFNSLMEAADRLSADARPEVFVAEPVGSCTDLVATVTYPLRRMYGENFSIAPLSVLVDPIRAARILELEAGGKFSPKVSYIYRKQLEEADLIVINKCDLLDPARLGALRSALESQFPRATLFEVSSRTGAGLDEWFNFILSEEQTSGSAMEVDYQVYAEGEALLGWLNATIQVSGDAEFDGNHLVRRLAAAIQERLQTQGAEVGHLKMTLNPDQGLGDLAVINLVRNDLVPELSQELEECLQNGQLIVNLRAEAPPEILRQCLAESLDLLRAGRPPLHLRLEHEEHFRPGKPVPTHRIANLV